MIEICISNHVEKFHRDFIKNFFSYLLVINMKLEDVNNRKLIVSI